MQDARPSTQPPPHSQKRWQRAHLPAYKLCPLDGAANLVLVNDYCDIGRFKRMKKIRLRVLPAAQEKSTICTDRCYVGYQPKRSRRQSAARVQRVRVQTTRSTSCLPWYKLLARTYIAGHPVGCAFKLHTRTRFFTKPVQPPCFRNNHGVVVAKRDAFATPYCRRCCCSCRIARPGSSLRSL